MTPRTSTWLARALLVSALVLGTLLTSGVARASAVRVTPVMVNLTPQKGSDTVALTNEGRSEVRVQCSGFLWDQLPNGEAKLTPTTDIVFFPGLVTVKPGETRKVRIGANIKPDSVEKSYRVFFEELPRLYSDPGEGSNVQVTTRTGIPVFIGPASTAPNMVLDGLKVVTGNIRFSVRNTGNGHFQLQKVRLQLFDPGGKVVATEELAGWYILPGGFREYEVPLSKMKCAGAKSATVSLETADGKTASATVQGVACP
jgi:fimbrial chaperone protein